MKKTPHTAWARHCEQPDKNLHEAHVTFIRAADSMAAGARRLSWPDLHTLHRQTVEAAMAAGYRMAMEDAAAGVRDLLFR